MKLPILPCALALVLAGIVPAHAGGSVSIEITAQGEKASRVVERLLRKYVRHQNGGPAHVAQTGYNNSAGLQQSGPGHIGVISQRGRNHSATLTQRGAGHSFGVFQFGKDTDVAASQRGRRGSSGLLFVRGW